MKVTRVKRNPVILSLPDSRRFADYFAVLVMIDKRVKGTKKAHKRVVKIAPKKTKEPPLRYYDTGSRCCEPFCFVYC